MRERLHDQSEISAPASHSIIERPNSKRPCGLRTVVHEGRVGADIPSAATTSHQGALPGARAGAMRSGRHLLVLIVSGFQRQERCPVAIWGITSSDPASACGASSAFRRWADVVM